MVLIEKPLPDAEILVIFMKIAACWLQEGAISKLFQKRVFYNGRF